MGKQIKKLGRNKILQTEVNQKCHHFLDSSDDGGSTARIKTFFSVVCSSKSVTLLLENFKLELKPAASSDADERVRISREVSRRTVLKVLGLSTVSCKEEGD